MRKRIGLFFVLVGFTIGCYDNKDICYQRPSIPFKFEFLNERGVASVPTGQVKISMPLFVKDTVITAAKSHDIFLNPRGNRTMLVFKNSAILDTLTIPYESKMKFFSEACGFLPTFNIDSAKIKHTHRSDTTFIKEYRVNYTEIDFNAKSEQTISIYYSLPTVAP